MVTFDGKQQHMDYSSEYKTFGLLESEVQYIFTTSFADILFTMSPYLFLEIVHMLILCCRQFRPQGVSLELAERAVIKPRGSKITPLILFCFAGY